MAITKRTTLYLYHDDKEDEKIIIKDIVIKITSYGEYETFVIMEDGSEVPAFMLVDLLNNSVIYREGQQELITKLHQKRKEQVNG